MAQGDTLRGVIGTTFEPTNLIRDVSEAIDFLSPYDVPVLDLVGKDSLSNACTQVKHEWMEDQLAIRSGTLSIAYVAGSGTMTLLPAGVGKGLVPDDLILVESTNCVYRVVAGPPDVDVATVAYVGGATDVAAAAAAAWRKIAHAAQEGGEARADMSKVAVGMPYNYTQILKDWAIVTGTMRSIKRYGYASERAYQEEQILRRLAIDLEHNILYGVRSNVDGPPRKSTMGGLLQYVLVPGIAGSWATVVNAAGGALTENMFNDALQAGWAKGANYDFVLVNGTNKRVMTSWAAPRIRTDQGANLTAGAAVARYESDFGSVEIILDRWLRASDIIIGSRGAVGLGPLSGRQFSSRNLPVTGDYDRYEILGEYTMEVHRPTIDWAWIYNTKTTFS